MSLPRPRPLQQRPFLSTSAASIEPDNDIFMPAVSKLREAGDSKRNVRDALDAIPPHLLSGVAAFAGDRHVLKWETMRALLLRVGLQTLIDELGIAHAGCIWRRYAPE